MQTEGTQRRRGLPKPGWSLLFSLRFENLAPTISRGGCIKIQILGGCCILTKDFLINQVKSLTQPLTWRKSFSASRKNEKIPALCLRTDWPYLRDDFNKDVDQQRAGVHFYQSSYVGRVLPYPAGSFKHCHSPDDGGPVVLTLLCVPDFCMMKKIDRECVGTLIDIGTPRQTTWSALTHPRRSVVSEITISVAFLLYHQWRRETVWKDDDYTHAPFYSLTRASQTMSAQETQA